MSLPPPANSPAVPACYRHPQRGTYVQCARCGRPICPDCMIPASVGHHCPECVAQGRREVRRVRTQFGGTGIGHHYYFTKALIGFNVAVMLLSAIGTKGNNPFFGGTMGGVLGSPTELMYRFATLGIGRLPDGSVQGVAEGQYYRLITAMFLHYGLLHLGMNMLALWTVGRVVEAFLGPARFLAVYVLAGVGGNVAAYVFSPHALTAGASTSIFGLFGALFVILKRLRRDTSAVLPIIIINVVFTLLIPGISIPGHLGGLVTGAVVAAGLAYAPRGNRAVVQVATCVGMSLFLLAVALWQTTVLTG